jgi:sterol O-acyltransferase
LVFTRQFTAFDRQNADSADSPFHGFFTLFWLGTAIYMIKLAAENWRQHGNILGSNEIMGLMFHRDVMVLGLSDGVMCGITGFGLILQKLIAWGFISWDNEGWIIQSVSSCSFQISQIQLVVLKDFPTVMGSTIHCCCPWLDIVPGMAVDTHSFLRASWPCYAHETTQLCLL